MNSEIIELLKTNEGWELKKLTQNKNKVDCSLVYKSNVSNSGKVIINFTNSSFFGRKADFTITAQEWVSYLPEPFVFLHLNVNYEFQKWFYKEKYIKEITKAELDSKVIEELRMRAWEYEGIDSELSDEIYRKLIDNNDGESEFRYGKFLRKTDKNYDEAIEHFTKAVEIYNKQLENENDPPKKNVLREIIARITYEIVLTYCKTEKYKEAFEEMNSIINSLLEREKDCFNILFHFVALFKKCKENKIDVDYNHLLEINDFLKFQNICTYILDINKKKEKVSGILLWIDLVDSTKSKENKEWPVRMLYFLTMTSIIFNNFSYKTIKYIGDEVMLFRPFDPNEEKVNVKQIYDIIFDEKWYFDEINKFNPTLKDNNDNTNDNYIKVKICIAVVEDVVKVYDIRNGQDKDEYDIIGNDIDTSARIKNLARKNMVVVNEKFKKYLDDNRGKYSECLKQYIWKSEFKGIVNEITYYGQEIEQ